LSNSSPRQLPRPLRYIAPLTLLVGWLCLYLVRDSWLAQLVGQFPDQIAATAALNRTLLLAIWATAGWTLLALVERFVWQGLQASKSGKHVPRLLTSLFTALIVLLTLSAILVTVFSFSPLNLGLLVGGLGLLLVLFFRDFLNDLFSGLSINLDDAVNIGDTVSLEGGHDGVLEQINWRSTHLRRPNGNLVIIPNSVFSNAIVLNQTPQADLVVVELQATLGFAVPVERAIRVLTAALHSAIGRQGLVADPPPVAWAQSLGTVGNHYQLKCYFLRAQANEGAVRTLMITQVMRHLTATGLALALPQQNVFLGEAAAQAMDWHNKADRQRLIANIVLFQNLTEVELGDLAEAVELSVVPAGTAIITEGELTTSMYGLAEGLLEVKLKSEKGGILKVGTMEPGDYFGEMSMLAGEPRSATVIAQVDSVIFRLRRAALQPILHNRPELTDSISRRIAERQLSNSVQLMSASAQEREASLAKVTLTLVGRIRKVFQTLKKDVVRDKPSVS
jgi:small-conductance mechanosensitive channel/CRP-like cAMP-binding protein